MPSLNSPIAGLRQEYKRRRIEIFIELKFMKTSTAFIGIVHPCVVDQYLPQHVCRDAEEMNTIFPSRLRLAHEPEVCPVD